MTSLITKRRTIKDNLIVFLFTELTLIYERSVESLLSRSKRRFIFQKDNRSDLDESKVFFLFIIDRRGSIDLILGRFLEEEG